jgi:hypothetical protein
MNKIENEYFYKILHGEGLYHFKKIYSVNGNNFQKGCGSYLFNGKKYKYFKRTYEKQKLLYNLAKQYSEILEIGVYMGHSILIMLLANPKIKITAIDIDKTFAVPSINYLKKKFPNAKINLINGDSLNVLKSLKKKFDLFHIDGAHDNSIVTKEFALCLNLRRDVSKYRILLDDVNSCAYLQKNILSSFNVSTCIAPKCENKNTFIEITIKKNLLINQLKNFNKNNFIHNISNYHNILIVKLYYIIRDLFSKSIRDRLGKFRFFQMTNHLKNKIKTRL